MGMDRQLSSLKQIFTQCSSIFSCVVELNIDGNGDPQVNQFMSSLGYLRLFNAVQILYVNDGIDWASELQVHIARVLGGLDGEEAAEVLPMLHTLIFCRFYLIREVVIPLLKPFVEARQQSGHPVAVR